MRFRFCGDADCPDWALAEMTTLSRLTSVKLKVLTGLVAQSITNPSLDMHKVEKLFADSKLTDDSMEALLKRCVACVAFILRSATRAGCDDTALGGELQQLGLPREHAQALRRVYTEHAPALRNALAQQSLRVNGLKKISAEPMSSSNELNIVDLTLTFHDANGEKVERIRIGRALLATVLKDAKKIRETMNELNAADHAL